MLKITIVLLIAGLAATGLFADTPRPRFSDLPADVKTRLDPVPLRQAADAPANPFAAQTTSMGEGIYSDRLPEFLKDIADCGYGWVKDYFAGGNVAEGEDIERKWAQFPAHYETYLVTAHKLGLKTMLRLDAPTYHGKEPTTPEGLRAVSVFYRQVVRRFKPWVKDWEIDNEPNIGNETPRLSPEHYVLIAKAAAEAIHAEDPAAKVYGPASAMLQCLDNSPYPYIPKLLDAGLLQYIDVFSYHPYRQPYQRVNIPEHASEFHPWTTWGTYTRQIADLRARLRAKAGREVPISATEVGYPTSKDRKTGVQEISLLTQAKYEQRSMIQDFALGVRPRVNFIFRRPWSDPYEVEHQFNLVDADNTHRPAYYAVQSVCTLFDGTLKLAPFAVRCEALPSANAQVYAFVTRTGGVEELRIAVWAGVPARDEGVDAGRCRLIVDSRAYAAPIVVDLMDKAPLHGKDLGWKMANGTMMIEDVPLRDAPVVVRAFAL